MLYNMVSHLRDNVNTRIESLEDARLSVSEMTGLTRDERLFLEAAFLDSESVEAFHTSLSRVSKMAVGGLEHAR